MSDSLVANRYRLLRRLAAGGMGEVHLAAQVGPAGYERVVALKRMLPSLISDHEGLKLFLDEARLMTQLNHRNICQIVELGEDPGGYFVALEFITGASVQALLEKLRKSGQRLDPYYAVDIAAQVAEALAYAYTVRGRDGQPLRLIHRDVTPHNILLSNAGDVKLIDFGVAKSTQQQHSTQSGMVKGKMGYLSPEQSRGKDLDGRSDLFSLGIVLYEMVSGTNPFAKVDLLAMVQAIQNDLPPPLGMLDPLWAPLEPVLAKLLAKLPDHRYPDANAAAEALLDLRSALPRPPQRLGPYVSERFGPDLEDLAKTISDSQMKIHPDGALAPSAVAADAPGQSAGSSPDAVLSPSEQMAPTLHKSSPAVQPSLVVGQQPTVVNAPAAAPSARPMRLGATGEESTDTGANAHPADPAQKETTLEDESSGESIEGAAIPRRSALPWGIGACLVAGFALAGWYASQGGPGPVPAPVALVPPLAVAATPTVIAHAPPVPAAPPAVAVAPAAAVDLAPPAPAPPVVAAPRPAALAIEPPNARTPVASVAVAHPPRGKHAKEVAPVPSVTAVGALVVSGAAHPLAQPSGHMDLVDPSGHFQIGVDYTVSKGLMKARITSVPWALVYVDGPSRGNTKTQPVELPPLGATPAHVELEHPGLETAKLLVTFQPR